MRILLPALALGLTLALPPLHAATSAENTAPVAVAPPLPAERFARAPLLEGVALSPDGKRIAGLMNLAEGTVLVTQRIDGSALHNVLSSDNKQMAFGWVQWVNNERLIASVHYRSKRGGTLVTETRLVAVDHDGGELIDLSAGGDTGVRDKQQIQDRVVDLLPGDGRHVLLQLNAPGTHSPAVYRVNIENGERRMVHSPERLVDNWITDAGHKVRAGIRREGTRIDILACDPDGTHWRSLWSYQLFAADAILPLGFDQNPNILFVQAFHEGRKAVFSVDLRDPGLKLTLRLAHRELDLDGELIRSPLSGEVVGFAAEGGNSEGGGTLTEFWDPELDGVARALDQALPGRFNRLLALSQDELRYLVHSSGNGIPGQYYIGDRESGRLTLLADQFNHLPPAQLVGKQAVRITARDGLPLRAWLTRPKNRPDGPGPLVLLPHGGPHSRDDNDFDPWTEFLASRGYTVLQVNFRGSSGYGHAFEMAGLQRWGMEMQDDLSDGVRWAIAEGIADPRRVCIVGGSYGGYAALMGSIKTPGMYRCVVSLNGVTDLEALIHHTRDFKGGSAVASLQFGSFWSDSARLHATSPVFHAEAVTAPALIIHGDADQIVPVEHGRRMAKALARAGRPHEYLELEGAGHSLGNAGHRLHFLTALERFLATHLGTRTGS